MAEPYVSSFIMHGAFKTRVTFVFMDKLRLIVPACEAYPRRIDVQLPRIPEVIGGFGQKFLRKKVARIFAKKKVPR